LIYCHFAEGIGEPKYAPVKNWTQLVKLLDEALHNYNELVLYLDCILSSRIIYIMYIFNFFLNNYVAILDRNPIIIYKFICVMEHHIR